jgi:hypothetical protein
MRFFFHGPRPMKPSSFLPFTLSLSWLMSGCVSIEMPGVVADTAKVVKDSYRSVTGKGAEPAAAGASAPVAAASAPAPSKASLSHSTIGSETQSLADLKQACINEAAQKLNQLSGKTVRYTVAENEVTLINGKPVANCRLAAEG